MQVNRCFNCMAELHHTAVCPLCGYDMLAGQKLPYALAPGTVLHGKYLMGRVLGQGGFGITYVGFDLALEIKVAVKECYISHQCLRNSATSTEVLWVSRDKGAEDYRNVFLREARKMAKIRDIPYLTRVLDIFHENETAYIVMDFVEGETLANRIQRQGAPPLTWEQALPIFQKVLHAMELVHQRGMIHRDLSPDNLMLEPDGNVRILDLGAAKDLNQGTGASSMVVAKNGFSPLEQYGQRGSSDARSDVYALAATMFFSLTKTLPSSPIDRLQEDRLELSLLREKGVPEYAVEAIVSGLALWQRDRPSSMAAFAALLMPPAEKPPPAPIEEPPAEEQTPDEEPASAPVEAPESAVGVLAGKKTEDRASPRPRWKTQPWKWLAAGCGLILLVLLGLQLPIMQVLLHPPHLTYTLRDDGCAVITGLDGTTDHLQIPTTLDGHYVAAIGESAFAGRTDFTTVTIEEGVDEIQARAFLNCTALTSVTLPDNLHTVGSWAFAGCTSLSSVTFPEGLKEIGADAFRDCALTEITLPIGCTRSFLSFDPDVSITDRFVEMVPEELQYTVGKDGGITITGYDGSVTSGEDFLAVPESLDGKAVTAIAADAFLNCQSLKNLVLPKSLRTIEERAFFHCTSLASVTFSEGLTSIGSSAFGNCTALTSVTLPSTVTTMDAGVFQDCTALEWAVLPDGLQILKEYMFYNCSMLSEVTFPEGLTWIYNNAFHNCALKEVFLPEDCQIYDASFDSQVSICYFS